MKTTCSPTFAGLTLNGTLTGQDIIPDGVDTRSLGSATAEWLNLYIGDAGKIYFGLAQDVNLYRGGANELHLGSGDRLVLNLDGYGLIQRMGDAEQSIWAVSTTHTTGRLRLEVTDLSTYWNNWDFIRGGDFRINAGKLLFSTDVNLYRSAANVLKTDDMLIIGHSAGLRLDTGPLLFSTAQDVNLYRYAVNVLATDDMFMIFHQSGLGIHHDSAQILFGVAEDVKLYRSAANVLKTDDNFEAYSYFIAGSAVIESDKSARFKDVLPLSASTGNLGTDLVPWANIRWHTSVDKTCADFGAYSIEKLYELFSCWRKREDGILHHSEGAKLAFPHIDFATIPDEFAIIATEKHELPYTKKLVNGKLVKTKIGYEKGEKCGIDFGTMVYALKEFVVKQYEEIQDLKKKLEARFD